MVQLYEPEAVYERLIHYDQNKHIQIRLSVNTFRGVEYLHLRKYYQDFDEEWKPSNEGIALPLDFNNSRELFTGLVEILSLAESKDIIESNFRDLIDHIYLK